MQRRNHHQRSPRAHLIENAHHGELRQRAQEERRRREQAESNAARTEQNGEGGEVRLPCPEHQGLRATISDRPG